MSVVYPFDSRAAHRMVSETYGGSSAYVHMLSDVFRVFPYSIHEVRDVHRFFHDGGASQRVYVL